MLHEQEPTGKSFAETQKIVKIEPDFVSNVAHSFNNTFQGITLISHLLRSSVENGSLETTRDLLDELDKVTDTASLTIQDLLAIVDRKEIVKKPTDVLSILQQSLNTDRLKPERIEAELKHEEHIPKIMGDEQALKQIFDAIIINSREAISERRHNEKKDGRISGMKLSITVGTVDDNLVIAIKDTGIGIPAENLPKVFDLFYSTKEEKHRKGQGLSMPKVKSLIAKHGGTITIESRTQQMIDNNPDLKGNTPGTTVTISIPINN